MPLRPISPNQPRAAALIAGGLLLGVLGFLIIKTGRQPAILKPSSSSVPTSRSDALMVAVGFSPRRTRAGGIRRAATAEIAGFWLSDFRRRDVTRAHLRALSLG